MWYESLVQKLYINDDKLNRKKKGLIDIELYRIYKEI